MLQVKPLEIDFLFVDENQRGNGLGSKILDRIEKEAISKGCKYVFLNTFGFQAKDFYPKHGYELAFQLENYPIL
ncbi:MULTISPECIES: GNAT family N-acetyltransferase [Bacillus cereus group]|uniref:GNAT family N-acetyltransferase n=1 Tax=Bacillus cereus group TaxID=86661 RepID=UPI001CBEA5AD|nr:MULTISPECIES: GNAT family N-acetyltransferase [Bacillus cereus group]MED2186843.1 GNAT family N-acetyltransferase [Bacillus wiedmannii]